MYRIIKETDIQNNRIYLNEEIQGKHCLELFTMNNNLYNVEATNNVIYIEATTLEIPPGNYNYVDLASTVETLLQTIDANFTFTYDTNTAKYTITNTTNFDLEFSNTINSAASLLGFTDEDNLAILTLTSPNISSLSTTPLFFIRIDQDIRRRYIGNSYFDASFVISDKSNFNEVIRVDSVNSPRQEIDLRLCRELQLNFINSDGLPMDMTNTNWIMILKSI